MFDLFLQLGELFFGLGHLRGRFGPGVAFERCEVGNQLHATFVSAHF